MRRTILTISAMLAALFLGSGVALALADAGPVNNADFSSTASSCTPKIIDLGTLGGPNSEAIEVNDSEWVVGGADTRNGGSHPALWRSGNIRDLGTLNFSDGEALGINERGAIVGTLYNGDPFDENGSPDRARGFVWRAGEMRRLPTLGGDFSYARRVNEFGVVAGSATLPNGNERATIWRNGKVKNLGTLGGNYSYALGINERSQVVGASAKRQNGPPHAFLWEDGHMRDLGTLGGPASQANVINNSGRVAGIADLPVFPKSHATVWEGDRTRDLGTLGGDFSFGLGMNDLGQVVGISDTSRNEPYHPRGFVWSGGLMLGLPTLGGDFGNSHGINNQGTVAGHSELPSGKSHATLYKCALGFGSNAYKAQQVSVTSSSAKSFGVESSNLSERTTSLDRLTPHVAPARR